jgi:hypothetical protein
MAGTILGIKSVLPTVDQVEQNDDPLQEMAQLMVGNSGYQILNRELEHLAADMGVDLEADTPAERLAEVIELFDGNRRMHRR